MFSLIIPSQLKHIASILFVFGAILMSCKQETDYYSLPAYSESNTLQAVIEIPSGTNHKFEYNKATNSFDLDQKNGKDRVIEYLPYLGNYGFIPSTLSDPDQRGDGDALDILVLSESLRTGTVTSVVPLGLLKLVDNGELDYKIIANISNEEQQVIKASTFEEFSTKYPNVKKIIELWFLNYNPDDPSVIEGWGDEKEAISTIELNLLK